MAEKLPVSGDSKNEPSTSSQANGGSAAPTDDIFMTSPKMYCVQPLDYCPHLDSLGELPKDGLDPFAACEKCRDSQENWVCLHCYKVFCGRFINQHMVDHGKDTGHSLTLSYRDLSVWCYECDSYVHNPVLMPAKEAAHTVKFGTPKN